MTERNESQSGGMEQQYDPFGNDVQQAQLIVLMKIYDVLMAIFTDSNPEAAEALDEAHAKGIVVGLTPPFANFAPRDDNPSPKSSE